MATGDPILSTAKSPKFEENRDRISNLPEAIIHHIFSFLETIDVIRSSAVSRKWRYLWVSLPYLNFKIEKVWIDPLSQWSQQTLNERFKDFVNWVFSSQNESCDIKRLSLSCLNFPHDYTVHRWMNIAARRNVKELVLVLASSIPFDLPNCLLTCNSLVVLKLEFVKVCFLNLPNIAGFSQLKSLELVKVELSDDTVARNFISNCPLLENLSMMCCTFRNFRVLEISSLNLKRLTIKNFLLDVSEGRTIKNGYDGLCNTMLKIACPNLVSFIYCGLLPQDFLLDNLISLEKAIIGSECDDKPVLDDELGNKMCKILRGLWHTKVLVLRMVFLEYLYPAVAKTSCLSASFNNLNTLKLSMRLDECYLQSLLYLLECCPNLEFLAIHFEAYRECDDDWKVPDKAIACLTHHLKMVELIDVEDHENELELVRFLLKNGLVLKKMCVFWLIGLDMQRRRKTYQKYREYDDVWKVPDKAIACLTYHLKMVELIEVESQENELELIGFLQKNGLVLEN